MISYCYGAGTTDAYPELLKAPNFDEFVNQTLAFPRARSREARKYICAPLRRNGSAKLHRCKSDVLPRAWLGHDLDGGSREEVEILLMRLSDYRAVAWETARATIECPRWRILVYLDREVDRAEGVRLGAALVGVLGAGLSSLRWDKSTHQGEQPCFLPMVGAEVKEYFGDAIDVDAILALAPEEPPRERPATLDPYLELIAARGLFIRELESGMSAIECPFRSEHTGESSESSTAYLHPHYNGFRWGKINCFHEHCRDKRTQEDFIEKLGGDPQYVWRGQAREELGKGADDQRAEERQGAAEEAAKGNGTDAESYPPIPARGSLIARPDQRTTAKLTPKRVVQDYLFADVALFIGPGSTGKTTLALWEATHIVLGRPLYGLEVITSGPVVFITAEDGGDLLFARLCAVMDEMGLSAQDRDTVWAGVEIWDVSGVLCRLAELDRLGNVQLTGLADAIVERFKDSPPVVLNFDPVISFGAGERLVNDNEQSLILAARRIVNGLGCCVRLTCHTGKQSARDGTLDQYAGRGGSALADGARMVAVLRTWGGERQAELAAGLLGGPRRAGNRACPPQALPRAAAAAHLDNP